MDVDRNILRLLDFPQGQVIKQPKGCHAESQISRPGGYEGRKETNMKKIIDFITGALLTAAGAGYLLWALFLAPAGL